MKLTARKTFEGRDKKLNEFSPQNSGFIATQG
jgi:hypothetical protein